MVPIIELLNRIRWDADFGKGRFVIGYCDHLEGRIIRVPFQAIRFERGNHFSFILDTPDGESLHIPLHRVREVLKDGILFWERAHADCA